MLPFYHNSLVLGRRCLAWGRIGNEKEHGFSILLVESDALYGKWLIMQNKSNLSLSMSDNVLIKKIHSKNEEIQKIWPPKLESQKSGYFFNNQTGDAKSPFSQ